MTNYTRRDFAKTLTGATGLTLFSPTLGFASNVISEQDAIFYELVKASDKYIPELLKKQVKTANHSGGIPDKYGIFKIRSTSHFIETLLGGYLTKESRFYKDETLIVPMQNAIAYLLANQNEDGTIDYATTNFHSPPDTGFVAWDLALCAMAIRDSDDTKLAKIANGLKTFLENAGRALVVGGIHTPNHRWVISNALACINNLYPNPVYEKRIAQWFSEGIDQDQDGQYAERSVGVYSSMVNECFINIARFTNRPELFDVVAKNLEMSLFYIHPSGELETSASTRQDKGFIAGAIRYHLAMRYMAITTGNKLFATAAREIEQLIINDIQSGNEANYATKLFHFTVIPALQKSLPKSNVPLPTDYRKYFEDSNLVRIRRGKLSATIFAQNDKVLSLHKGATVLEALRISHAFFGRGTFKAQEIQVTGSKIILKEKLSRGYSQPLPDEYKRADGNWHKMENDKREQTGIQQLNTTVTIEESESGGFSTAIEIEGTRNVLVAIEMGFRKGGQMKGVVPVPDIENAYFLKEGTGSYEYDGQTISFGPGVHVHQWTQMRGALPKLNAESVYLTGNTPVTFNLEIS